MPKSDTSETVYERIAQLEDEVASLRNELDFLKNAMRNKIARHEIKIIRKGTDVSSMID